MKSSPDVAALLKEYADRSALKGGNLYRARAYRRAAESLSAMPQPLGDIIAKGQLRTIPGVGDSIAAIIERLHSEGTHPSLEKLRREIPEGLADISSVPGIRPTQAAKLQNKLGIRNLDQLEKAAREGRIAATKRLGPALERKVLQGLEVRREAAGKYHINRAAKLLEAAKNHISRTNSDLSNVTIAGDFRRGCELVERLALAAIAPSQSVKTISQSGGLAAYVSPRERFGAALLFATGSNAHLKVLSEYSREKGMRLTEQGLMRGKRLIAAATEADIYDALDLQYIEPELREGAAEIAQAAKHALPALVTLSDLRGIIHAHTEASDGTNTLSQMAEAVRNRGYLYFGISDHSRSAHYAGGLSIEEINAQRREIAQLNRKYKGNFRIFSGIESDILADGSLDYPEVTLRKFDFVIASVHSQFHLSRDEQTARIIKAVRNPRTTILGHMTGRQLLRRPGYEVDIDKVLKACARHEVAVEINANPWRLDLDWRWHRRALELGCMLSINPDAHSTSEIDNTHWGVEMARKGGVPKGAVLNALDLSEFASYLKRRKASSAISS